jgi:hypothetical protein
MAVDGISNSLPVPHVPFVEGEPQLLSERCRPCTMSQTASVSSICRSIVRFNAMYFEVSPPVSSGLLPKYRCNERASTY